MLHVCGRGEVHIRFWWGNLREGGHLEDLGVDGSGWESNICIALVNIFNTCFNIKNSAFSAEEMLMRFA
jgi:hypothetical protein